MRDVAPVLAIGLDAAELDLIELLLRQGRLPTLNALRQRGRFGTLASNAGTFTGGVWPTLYTAADVPWHGIYHNKLWRHPHMRCEIASDSWLPARPFWEVFDPAARIAIIDVPMTVAPPRPVNGLQLSGWGTHDLIVRGSWPRSLWGELARKFGPPVIRPELYGPQNEASLLALRENLLQTTDQMAEICCHLLARERWDLFLVVLGAPHRGGHYLWDLSQIDAGGGGNSSAVLAEALTAIYQRCDTAVGRMLDRAPAGARVLLFAVHGMGPNRGWSDHCEAIGNALLRQERSAPIKKGMIYAMKKRLPWGMARQVLQLLPLTVRNRLVPLWSARMFDWQATPWFPLPMDQAGYFRVNLQGREPQGIVAPGREYRQTVRRVQELFESLRETATGRKIVARVSCLDDLAPAEAPYRDFLPDLIVEWGDLPAAGAQGLRSDIHGEIDWRPGPRLPSGRSGNHTARGWFLAAGPGIDPSMPAPAHRITDLAPTLCRWLGQKPPAAARSQAPAM